MINYYSMKGIKVLDYYYCPHYPISQKNNCFYRDCFCRKPRPLNFLKCLKKYKLRPENCIMVGDRQTDIKPAKALKFKKLVIIDRECSFLAKNHGRNIIVSNLVNLRSILW